MTEISQLQSKSILVIGDVMLDNYCVGDIRRISPEAPVPVLRKRSEHCSPGGAANVAVNLMAAGQRVSVLSILGTDENGCRLMQDFAAKGICSDMVLQTSRETTTKTRFLAGNNQQVLRLDVEDTRDISGQECTTLLGRLKERISTFDLVIISDYCKGLLTEDFTQGVIHLARGQGVPVVIDVKDPQCDKYAGALLLKPNRSELASLTCMPVGTDEEIVAAATQLQQRCSCRYLLTTLGARGMVLVGDGNPLFVKSAGKEVFDVSGAGDTTIAYLAACLANQWPIRDAIRIANCAAGIQVGKIGTSSVSLAEVRRVLAEEDGALSHKLLSDKDLESFREDNAGKRIVFTNGCFDILHLGHKRYLQQAATLGDILVIGVNSDDSVRRLKGPGRPVNPEMDRAEMLCAFSFVDYVILFREDTPYELIRKIQPDVLVKGGDYKIEEVVGRDLVENRGGRVVILPFVKGKSTTGILEHLSGAEHNCEHQSK